MTAPVAALVAVTEVAGLLGLAYWVARVGAHGVFRQLRGALEAVTRRIVHGPPPSAPRLEASEQRVAELERWHAAWTVWAADGYPEHGQEFTTVTSGVRAITVIPAAGCECHRCRAARMRPPVDAIQRKLARFARGGIVGVCLHPDTVDVVVAESSIPVARRCVACGADVAA